MRDITVLSTSTVVSPKDGIEGAGLSEVLVEKLASRH